MKRCWWACIAVSALISCAAGESDSDVNAWDRMEEPPLGGKLEFDDVEIGEVDFTGKVDQFELDPSRSFEENLQDALRQSDNGMSDEGAREPLLIAERIETPKELEDFVRASYDEEMNGGGVVGFFSSSQGEKESPAESQISSIVATSAWQAFEKLSNEFASFGVRFAYTTNPALLEENREATWNIVAYRPPAFVDFKGGEALSVRFPISDGTLKQDSESIHLKDSLAAFLRTSLLPRVGEITYENEELYASIDKAVICIYTDIDKENEGNYVKYMIDKARQIASSLSGLLNQNDFLIALVNISSDMYNLRYFSAELLFTPSERKVRGSTLVALRKQKGEYYKMNGPMESVEATVDFLVSVLSDKDGTHRPVRLEGQYLQAAKGPGGEEQAETVDDKDEL